MLTNLKQHLAVVVAVGGVMIGGALAAGDVSTELAGDRLSTTVSDPVQEPSSSSQAEEEIDAFVRRAMSELGSGVSPVVDRKQGTIRLNVTAESLATWSRWEGQEVGGLTVVVRSARFTPAELDAAIERIATGDFTNSNLIESFSDSRDGSYLRVRVRELIRLEAPARDALLKVLTRLARGPVRLEPAISGANLSRVDDSAPWLGGGWMVHLMGAAGLVGDRTCSIGFSVLLGTQGRLLSAAHCLRSTGEDTSPGNPTWDWNDGTRSDVLATATARYTSPGLDSMLLDPVGGTTGEVHGGPWNATSTSTTRYHLSVYGSAPTFIGETLCTSGANSGEHCALEVYDKANVACPELGICHRWLAYSTVGGAAVTGGDSGGPVYKPLVADPDRVGARGIIKAGGNFPGDCPSMRWSTKKCYQDVLFVGIEDILDHWNAAIETH